PRGPRARGRCEGPAHVCDRLPALERRGARHRREPAPGGVARQRDGRERAEPLRTGGGVTLTVCLSFDFDAVAVPRILDMLERTGARATFFVPGHTALAYPPLVRAIAADGHELAPH